MNYAYQRTGAPILQWGRTAPLQSRAADAVSLGSLGGTTLANPTLVLPKPGAPEPVGVTPPKVALSGCSCSGSCGCGPAPALSGLVDSIPGGYVTLGVAAYFAWKFLKKR